MIIAVDGPAASGKGTLALRLARHYGLSHLDTGLIYRAVAVKVLRAGGRPEDEAAAMKATRNLDLDGLDQEELRSRAAGEAASIVAAMPAVRRAVLRLQREFAKRDGGAVLDGRDIGTVVCPDADIKLFVSASPEERARRRHEELKARGADVGYDEVLAEINARDERDRQRAVAPLRPADDAHLLDTSDLDIEAAFRAAVAIIERHN